MQVLVNLVERICCLIKTCTFHRIPEGLTNATHTGMSSDESNILRYVCVVFSDAAAFVFSAAFLSRDKSYYDRSTVVYTTVRRIDLYLDLFTWIQEIYPIERGLITLRRGHRLSRRFQHWHQGLELSRRGMGETRHTKHISILLVRDIF